MLINETQNNFVEVACDVVVVDHVDQEKSVSAFVEELDRFFVSSHIVAFFVFNFLVDWSPFTREAIKAFFLPYQEGLMVNHSWLDDLSASEDSPGDSVHITRLHIFVGFTFLVDGLVGQILKLIEIRNQRLDQTWVNQKLKVSFLINKSIGRSPAVSDVIRSNPVNLGLRVGSKHLVFVHGCKDIQDFTCFE